MKTKLVIGILLIVANSLNAQISSVEFNVNLVPSYYKNSNPDILDYNFFEGNMANQFVLIKNMNFDIMINKYIGFQIGFQEHKITLENTDYIIEYQFGGNEMTRINNDDYTVKISTRRLETPISLILLKSINQKLDLSMLIGGSRMLRPKTVKYELRNKENGNTEKTKSKIKKVKTMSNFSPQIQFRMQYKLLERIKINSLILMKSKELSQLEKIYLGGGIGISFRLH